MKLSFARTMARQASVRYTLHGKRAGFQVGIPARKKVAHNLTSWRQFSEGTGSGNVVEAAGGTAFSSRSVLALVLAGVGLSAVILFSRGDDNNKAQNETKADNALGTGSMEERVKQLEAEVSRLSVINKNRAFVFIKPHAVTEEVEKLIKDTFAEKKIKIITNGEISGEVIDRDMLVDTHYGAIASKAVKLLPSELNVSDKAKADFEKMSGISWEEALKTGKVRNAMQYCEEKSIDGEQLDEKWSKLKRGKNLLKFGGGFYCGQLEKDEFVINGFYMSMRSKFTGPENKIKYFVVEFRPSDLSWEDFRGSVLGGTDPAGAEKGSLRRKIFDNWQKLGLATKPNTGDNGVHASASPFEAFAERCNWLKDDFKINTDKFGTALLANGMLKQTVTEYMEDPAVQYEGSKQSVFDLLEDLDTEDCLEKILDIAKA